MKFLFIALFLLLSCGDDSNRVRKNNGKNEEKVFDANKELRPKLNPSHETFNKLFKETVKLETQEVKDLTNVIELYKKLALELEKLKQLQLPVEAYTNKKELILGHDKVELEIKEPRKNVFLEKINLWLISTENSNESSWLHAYGSVLIFNNNQKKVLARTIEITNQNIKSYQLKDFKVKSSPPSHKFDINSFISDFKKVNIVLRDTINLKNPNIFVSKIIYFETTKNLENSFYTFVNHIEKLYSQVKKISEKDEDILTSVEISQSIDQIERIFESINR